MSALDSRYVINAFWPHRGDAAPPHRGEGAPLFTRHMYICAYTRMCDINTSGEYFNHLFGGGAV